jgi:3-hydroxyisobutyrate dehydrogenase
MLNIGFIGFGEAGFHIAKGLRASGAKVFAFDTGLGDSRFGQRIRHRAGESDVTMVESLSELAQACDVIFCAVTAHSAVQAARDCAVSLSQRHIFVDLNSVSPATKRHIAEQIAPSHAQFVEAAVMAAVPPLGHRVPILMNGEAAHALITLLAPLGMRLDVMQGEIGAAAAVKMCRSIVLKGMEALMLECVLAASKFGASERVFASLDESYPNMNWERVASYMIGRAVLHGARRAHEMDEVASMLRENDIEPMMAEATARRLYWCAEQGWEASFRSDEPKGYLDVIRVLTHRQK